MLVLTFTVGSAVAALSWSLPATARRPAGPADPLSVILLLDASASVSRSPMFLDSRFAEIFNAFLYGLKAGDRSAVGVIAKGARFTPLTSDPREMTTGVRALLRLLDADRLGPSPIWDATDEALTLLEGTPGHCAIVLFTDGKASGNLHGSSEILAHAKRLGATIDAVIEGGGTRLILQPESALDPAEVVRRVAEGSGGHLWLDRPTNPRERNPAARVTQIMEGLQR
jgi:hypothetical protein